MADRLAVAQQALLKAETQAGVRRRQVNPAALSPQLLPVPQEIAPLFQGGGLRRGSVVQVRGSASMLLAIAAAAGADADSWCAMIAMPDAGLIAAAESGLDLRRTVVVPKPGPDAPAVLGALIDGFDVVVLGHCPALSEADRRAATHRVRTRQVVLLTSMPWAQAHTVLQVTDRSWSGLGAGTGVLTGAQVTVAVTRHDAGQHVLRVPVSWAKAS
ncbi:MAG: hypothetical protein ACK5H2_11440 [Beutenbergiaceae bacterium]